MEQALDVQEIASKETIKQYAPFGVRFAAMLIDGIILMLAGFVLDLIFFGEILLFDMEATMRAQQSSYYIFFNILSFAMGFIYSTAMVASNKQATLGKLAVGIKIGKENGEKLTFLNATGRYFAHFVSVITLCIGYLMVLWDKKHQGLHDKICNTYVFYK